MKKLIFSAAVIYLFMLGAGDVFACSCSLPTKRQSLNKQIKTSYKNADAIFYGEVTEVTQLSGTFYVTVKFKVEKSWKNLYQEQVIIQTGQGNGDCGYRFEIGSKYLVYAYGNSNKLRTDNCTRTSVQDTDMKYLDKIKKPVNFAKATKEKINK